MSFVCLKYHLVFATKGRRPVLADPLLPRLRQYIGGIIRDLGGQMLAANGMPDHLHIAAILTQKLALMEVLKQVKAGSSVWIHDSFPERRDFDWQDGYAAFTVSQSATDAVIKYIEDQQRHHKTMSFEEELVRLLEKHGIQYDPRYMSV